MYLDVFRLTCITLRSNGSKSSFGFFLLDLIAAAKRFVSRPRLAGILYPKYEQQSSLLRLAKLAFGRANSGLDVQSAPYIDKYSASLLLLFYVDKSYTGKHRTHGKLS
jgi:hypothetical protein